MTEDKKKIFLAGHLIQQGEEFLAQFIVNLEQAEKVAVTEARREAVQEFVNRLRNIATLNKEAHNDRI